ncbi:hypothetical protein EVAR_27771_1 [Eumeta japonica]|uniref:Uncharacterized protein n=1 Tax=Eumeta variegata TaxID=151549 RepID=A0A4C1VBE4_EUMVA|nr:hypothetical protein EVAR_27771_1 [Eumeta japonica]
MATFSTLEQLLIPSTMSIKRHYLHSYLDYFPENFGDLSEERGERFQQDIRTMKERCLGYWNRSENRARNWRRGGRERLTFFTR